MAKPNRRTLLTSDMLPPMQRAILAAQSYDISTVAGLIEALGGHKAVTREFDLGADDTRRWEVTGHIPTGWHLRLFAKTLGLKLTVAPVVFGFPATSADWLALSAVAAHYAEGCAHG